MAKFVIKCPSENCNLYVQASNFIFARRTLTCACGTKFEVKAYKMASRECPHCGNNVVYDQSKGEKARCPVCGEKINTVDSNSNKVEFKCPTCSCTLSANKNATSYTCPLCDTVIDVQAQAGKEAIRKKGVISDIKYEGDNQTFVWKHPIEDFNLGSQLTVDESQEAIFFRDGQALDLFEAGRYTLATQNLPLLENLYKIPANTDTFFHAKVYFINKTVQMGIKWGTDSKVNMFDPASGLHLELGACGEFSLQVCDSRKLLVKLVGTAGSFKHADVIGNSHNTNFTGDRSSKSKQADENNENYGIKPTIGKFRAMIMTKVKSNLVKIIKENNVNILEVDEYLDVISDGLRDKINEMLLEYGLTTPEFYVTTITLPDDPNIERLKQQHADMHLKVQEEKIRKAEAEASAERQTVEAQTAARMKIIGAQGDAEAYKIKAAAEAEEMRMKGYTYQQETARQVGLGAVENMGNAGGGGIGDIAGLGISLGAMGGVMNMTKDALNPMMNTASAMGNSLSGAINDKQDTWDCQCGKKGIVENFCNKCGAKRPEPPETWDCSCGKKGNIDNFCSNCGARKPEEQEIWECSCGKKGNTDNFCSNCGAKKPESPETWECSCGKKGNTDNFCSNCGTKKPEPPETWDCSCGKKGITGNFCDNCGRKKGEEDETE